MVKNNHFTIFLLVPIGCILTKFEAPNVKVHWSVDDGSGMAQLELSSYVNDLWALNSYFYNHGNVCNILPACSSTANHTYHMSETTFPLLDRLLQRVIITTFPYFQVVNLWRTKVSMSKFVFLSTIFIYFNIHLSDILKLPRQIQTQTYDSILSHLHYSWDDTHI